MLWPTKLNKIRKKLNMCKFMSTLPKHSNIIGAPKRNPNLELFLQPCKDKDTYYRVRLLAFSSSKKNDRDDPHITRFVHQSWMTDPKTGKKKLEKIVCSAHTPWVKVEGNKASSCKICNYVGQQWSIYNESGKTDVDARTKAGTLGKRFEAVIPVYVKNDPNYEKNNGKFKVIIMTDKEEYMNFRKQIDAKLREVQVFNGVNAADCLIHVSTMELAGKNGKTYKRNGIDKILFSTKPSDIPAINSKNIDAFPFDDTYYSSSDDEEVNDFYSKYCAITNDDIPDSDDIPVYTAPAKTVTKVEMPQNDIPSSNDDISDDELDNLIDDTPKAEVDPLTTDPDEEGLDDLPEPATKTDTDDSDDILKDLGL